jgi:peptidoglycan/LPS O-acetylase OafA/YrhL
MSCSAPHQLSTLEKSMNTLARLISVFLGIGVLSIFGFGFATSTNLSVGQNLMLWSTASLSLLFFTAAFHTDEYKNEVTALMGILAGVFLALLCFGMHKQTGEWPYGVFAWLGIMFCGTAVAMMTFYGSTPETLPARC